MGPSESQRTQQDSVGLPQNTEGHTGNWKMSTT